MPRYGDPNYWEERYREQDGTTFDWLETWDSLKPTISRLVGRGSNVLVLGCGNAEFSEDMYADGYEHIWNVDTSETVIQQMSLRNSGKTELHWEVMDVRDLKFPDETFDLAVDKATIDALLCGDAAYLNVAKMTREVQRVLKTGGHYLAVTYGDPETRLEHFERPHLAWTVSHEAIGAESDKTHYVYLCCKQEDAEEQSQHHWREVEEALAEDDFALLRGS